MKSPILPSVFRSHRHGPPILETDMNLSKLVVLVYRGTLMTRDSGYSEMMVYTTKKTAMDAVNRLSAIGIDVEAVPLTDVLEKIKHLP